MLYEVITIYTLVVATCVLTPIVALGLYIYDKLGFTRSFRTDFSWILIVVVAFLNPVSYVLHSIFQLVRFAEMVFWMRAKNVMIY